MPCATSARLTPVSGTTSHTVPSATRSSHCSRSGSGRSAYQPASRSARLTATASRKATPTAASAPCGLVSSSRFGLTTATAARQQRLGDVVIDDDHVEPGLLRRGERLVRGRAAIDRDGDRRALCLQAQQRRRVRAVAFAHAVGHIDRGAGADRREKPQQQRRRGRAVHVVIAEDDDRLAVADRADEAGDGRRHVAQMRRVRELLAQARREKDRRLGKADAALRQQPPDDLRQPEPLRDQQRRARRRTRRTRQRRPQTERSTPRKGGRRDAAMPCRPCVIVAAAGSRRRPCVA